MVLASRGIMRYNGRSKLHRELLFKVEATVLLGMPVLRTTIYHEPDEEGEVGLSGEVDLSHGHGE